MQTFLTSSSALFNTTKTSVIDDDHKTTTQYAEAMAPRKRTTAESYDIVEYKCKYFESFREK